MYAPSNLLDTGKILGQFREADYGVTFEYSETDEETPFPGFETQVWVSDGGFRWAKVLKTVAHVVVDEGFGGVPVVNKWHLRGHRQYMN